VQFMWAGITWEVEFFNHQLNHIWDMFSLIKENDHTFGGEKVRRARSHRSALSCRWKRTATNIHSTARTKYPSTAWLWLSARASTSLCACTMFKKLSQKWGWALFRGWAHFCNTPVLLKTGMNYKWLLTSFWIRLMASFLELSSLSWV